jgi:heat shock protein HtpX
MARHRLIRFDDASRPELKNIIPTSDPRYPTIRRRMMITFGKTFLGHLGMGALCAVAIWLFGLAVSWQSIWSIVGWFGVIWIALPMLGWWFSAPIALRLQKAVPFDPTNEQHQWVKRCLDIAFEDSDLEVCPPLYASPDKRPNAFATGRNHSQAVVAFTEGLLSPEIGMTERNIIGIFAHELAHVRNYDVLLNSLMSAYSMFFFLIVNAGLSTVLGGIDWARRIFRLGQSGFVARFLSSVLFLPIFWLTSQLTRVLQMFVIRSRESGADATGAYFTGDPCGLVDGLRKLADYVEKHRPKPGSQEFGIYQVLRPMMIIDPLFDSNKPPVEPKGLFVRLKALWEYLQLTHPPVTERVEELERMNGGVCPVE